MSDSVLLPVPTTRPPHVTDRSYSDGHPHPGGEVAAAQRRGVEPVGSRRAGRRLGPEVAVDHRADVDQLAGAAERRDDRLGIGARGRRRRPVRHQHASSRSAPIASATRYATTAESIPPDSAEHRPLEAGLLELAADELADDAAGDVGVDRQLGRQLERRHGLGGRVRSRSCAAIHAAGRACRTSAAASGRRRLAVDPEPDRRPTAPRPAATSKPGSAPGSACRVDRPSPARSATIRLSSRTCSSSRSSRRSGSAIRSRRMSAVGMSTRYSPSS